MTVYIDVIVLENVAINFLILAATSYLSRYKASTGRKLAGATLGAVYVLAAFFPGFKIYFTIMAKILLSFVMIAVTFWPEKVRDFVKLTLFFYLVSFVFGGAAFGLYYFLDQEGGIENNGVYSINGFPLKTLIVSLTFAYIVIRFSWNIFKSRVVKENVMVPVSIEFDKKRIVLDALIDTGNTLKDPISNLPVVVVEFGALEEILPCEVSTVFRQGDENNLDLIIQGISNTEWASKFRLIPFSSLGKDNGMLIGFRPKKFEIGDDNEKKDYKDVVVGIYNRDLSKDNSYKALLGLELVNN